MEFNIKSIEELKEGGTYLITFPDDVKIETMRVVVDNLHKLLKENNRNIVFLYTVDGVTNISEVK